MLAFFFVRLIVNKFTERVAYHFLHPTVHHHDRCSGRMNTKGVQCTLIYIIARYFFSSDSTNYTSQRLSRAAFFFIVLHTEMNQLAGLAKSFCLFFYCRNNKTHQEHFFAFIKTSFFTIELEIDYCLHHQRQPNNVGSMSRVFVQIAIKSSSCLA